MSNIKYISTLSLMSFSLLAFASSTSGDLSVHMVGANTLQSADRLRSLLNTTKDAKDTLLDMVDTESIGGVGTKASDNTYNATGGTARIDKYLGNSAVVGASLGGIYTEAAGDSVQGENLAIMANLYAARKSSSLPLGTFVDLGYSKFLGDGQAFGSSAMSALGGLSLTFDTGANGLSYSPLLMLNSLYLQDSANSESYNGLKMLLGVELDYQISETYTASLKGLYNYELMDTSAAYNYNSFTGTYTSLGNVGNNSLQFGAGIDYNINDAISAGFDYSVFFYNNFTSRNLSFKIDLSF